MVYPPTLPPATRTDSTVAAGNHASDHNQIVAAIRDLVEAIGADPAGDYVDLTSRITDVSDRFETIRVRRSPAYVLQGAGIDPTGVSDSTTGLRNAVTAGLALGFKRFVPEPDATYKVAVASGSALFTLTGTKGVVFDLGDCKIDNSATSYTADVLTPMWLLDGCEDTVIRLREYLGYELPAPASYLGYRGATLVRAINATKNTTVDARAKNLRYGVQTGEYGDATKGGCSGFRIKLRGSMIGYPIAAYYADNIEHDIDVDGVHRAVYIAGVNGARGLVRFKDQYIADTVYLITDALTSGTDAAAQANPSGAATTSRGCTDVDVTVIDKGSTVFQPSSSCSGITMSRVDPCAFRNIRVRTNTVGTDTVSTTMGGFRIVSGAKSVWNRYPFNWEPTIVLDNIRVSGVVDHSACTLPGNTGSEFYVLTYDGSGAHSATVRNFEVADLTILPSSGQLRGSYFQAPNCKNVRLSKFHTPGLGLSLFTNGALGDASIEDSRIGQLDGLASTVALIRSDVDGLDVVTTARVIDSTVHGARGVNGLFKHTTLTLAGASTSWTSAIPQGATVKSVLTRVNTAITGATQYDVGVAAETGRYGAFLAIAAGTTSGNRSWSGTEVTLARNYTATTDLVITARGPAFTGGVVRVVLIYELATNLTS